MELQTEDGRTICLSKGCRKELGRGPGLTCRDRTVSRRQIVLELLDGDASSRNSSKVCVEVVGANPICILRHGNRIPQVISPSDCEGVEFLEKGCRGVLRVGDKVSLSIKEPSFLTLKVQSDEDQEQKIGSRLTNVAPLDEPAVQGAPETNVCYDSAMLLKEEKESYDLLDAWKSRKLAKKGDASDPQGKDRSFQNARDDFVERSTGTVNEHSGEGNQTGNYNILEQEANQSHPSVQRNNTTISSSKEEEEGIAEAVARRKKLSLKSQEAQSKQRNDQEWKKPKKADESEATTSADNGELDYTEAGRSEWLHRMLPQVDPVVDLGFIVEGSEFDRFKGRKFEGRMLNWHINKKQSDYASEEEEENEEKEGGGGSSSVQNGRKKIKSSPRKSSLHGRTEEEDDDWLGENEEEKLLVAKVKKPRQEIGVQKRSKHSGSYQDKQGKMTKRTKNKLAQSMKADGEGDDLTGFIVEDNVEVDSDQGEDDEEEKDDWIDESSSENSQDEDLKAAKDSKERTKPLCMYGTKCYRKSKEHLLQFRHPKA